MNRTDCLNARQSHRTLLAFVVFSLIGCSSPAPESERTTAAPLEIQPEHRLQLDQAAFEGFIRDFLDRKHVPGIAVAVVDAEGPLFTAGYGLADVERKIPMTPETVLNIASITKTVTATAVLQLHDRGLLALDEDVSEHLPFAVRHPLHPAEPITVRRLLTHTASIEDSDAYGEGYACGDPKVSLADWIRGYFEPGGAYYDAQQNFLSAPPGAEHSYSNIGFGLLGYLVEVVSGQALGDYTREHIFEPLGMSETGWYLTDIDPARHATLYDWIPSGTTLDHPLFVERNGELITEASMVPFCHYSFYNLSDGLLRTSIDQFARFLVAYIRGGEIDGHRILAVETVAEALSIHISADHVDRQRFDQGFAWRLRHDEMGDFWAHSGGDPGVRTRMLWSPETGIGVLVFANQSTRVEEVVVRLLEEATNAPRTAR